MARAVHRVSMPAMAPGRATRARLVAMAALALALVLASPARPDSRKTGDVDPERSARAEAAEEATTAEPPAWNEEIVVTATRGDRAVGEVALNATVVGRREIEAAPETRIDEILRNIPSFGSMQETASTTSTIFQQSFSLRGL
ncbi:MAG: Plug domain-containing protein, partial [Thermoanaerobaculia bacterium]|nr:Plug domain-containing protein [Thermoanaerobaculia bacterium]